jgi:glycogen debranching enzyme
MARLSQMLGERGVAERCQAAADALRERFDHAFWSNELGMFALALDGSKQPCLVKTSNAGQCLYSGIVKPERVGPLARSLLSPELFSGWGIRTVASDERRFNPMSYHRGSIWPHDTAIIAAGLSRHGAKAEAAALLGALFDAALSMDLHRMPELFCGFPRRQGEAPTQYPVACSPQAWAAGSVYLLLGAVLGLEVYAAENRVVLRNTYLPPFLQEVHLHQLKVGRATVDLTLRRHASDVGMTVDRKQGDVEVVAVR